MNYRNTACLLTALITSGLSPAFAQDEDTIDTSGDVQPASETVFGRGFYLFADYFDLDSQLVTNDFAERFTKDPGGEAIGFTLGYQTKGGFIWEFSYQSTDFSVTGDDSITWPQDTWEFDFGVERDIFEIKGMYKYRLAAMGLFVGYHDTSYSYSIRDLNVFADSSDDEAEPFETETGSDGYWAYGLELSFYYPITLSRSDNGVLVLAPKVTGRYGLFYVEDSQDYEYDSLYRLDGVIQLYWSNWKYTFSVEAGYRYDGVDLDSEDLVVLGDVEGMYFRAGWKYSW